MKNKNKKVNLFLFTILLMAGFFGFCANCSADDPPVVINELMWMGSSISYVDEWVELKNLTSNLVDIGGWKIENAATSTSGGTLIIPSGKSIPASGYFLIANYSKDDSSHSALNVSPDWVENDIYLGNDSNGNLILKNSSGTAIDSAKGTP